jgi:riboflavin synthase
VFTGIVEERGEVVGLDAANPTAANPTAANPTAANPTARLTVRGPVVTTDTRPGDSIAVNGVCLTAATVDAGTFTADVMGETLARSALGQLRTGDPVNLERAVTPTTRLGGHLVQGHVDGVGTVLTRSGNDVEISLPDGLHRYVVEKGSITVDGVSLTVVAVADDRFRVSLIPTTLAATTLGVRAPGDPVNLEVDVIAKYVAKLLNA